MSQVEPRVLVNRHSGERLTLRRVKRDGEIWLEVIGTTPPKQPGPPMHVHLAEIEDVKVGRGILSAIVDGKQLTAGAGESAVFPAGVAHRWWNGHDEPLELAGYARPVVDLDVYLQAIFEIINAGPAERPRCSIWRTPYGAIETHNNWQSDLRGPNRSCSRRSSQRAGSWASIKALTGRAARSGAVRRPSVPNPRLPMSASCAALPGEQLVQSEAWLGGSGRRGGFWRLSSSP